MEGLTSQPLFTMTLDVDGPPQIIGIVPEGHMRRVANVTGGKFVGSRMKGRVLPGGSAWSAVRSDGIVNLEVRIVLETDENELVYLTYQGRRGGPPDIVARFTRGEPIPDGADYFRVLMMFETAAPPLLWLNDIVAVGVGRRPPTGPSYDVFEIL